VRARSLTSVVTVQSFDWRTLIALKTIAPEIATSCLTITSTSMNTLAPRDGKPSPWLAGLDPSQFAGSVPKTVKAAGCNIWSPFWRNIDAATVSEAQALGLRVLPWTINTSADMAAVIALGVDGLITDYPDRAISVLAEKNILIAR
jgi:glycerophosphoryl diester phosphodiesterase